MKHLHFSCMAGAIGCAKAVLALFRSSSAHTPRSYMIRPYRRRTSQTTPTGTCEGRQTHRVLVTHVPELMPLPGLRYVDGAWATRNISSRVDEGASSTSDGSSNNPENDGRTVSTHAFQGGKMFQPNVSSRRQAQSLSLCPHTMTTADWVSHILAPGLMETMDRRNLTQAFRTITHMLNVGFHPASPAHQVPIMRRRAEVLKCTLDPQLPLAIAMLIAKADGQANACTVPNRKVHPPIALKLTADLLKASPQPLLQSVLAKQEVADALPSILQACCTYKPFLQNPKYASMIFHSLVTLRECGAFRVWVNKACYSTLGRIRLLQVAKYDLPALEGLCWLIVQFRKNQEQRLPRVWWIAMRQIEELASVDTLQFGHAARIAESIAAIGKAPKPAIESALRESATQAATPGIRQAVSPVAVSKYLDAAARLRLHIDVEVVKSLFFKALGQSQKCKLVHTMSMLASLQSLDIQPSVHESKLANQQILRHLDGATMVETLKFLHDARQIQMQLGDKFVSLATKSIASGLNRPDVKPEMVAEAYSALNTILVRYRTCQLVMGLQQTHIDNFAEYRRNRMKKQKTS